MKTIAIIGTSNSIIGERGYIKALRNSFAVDNLSIGRSTVHRHITVMLSHPDRLASADLILIEHYVNDVDLYAELFKRAGLYSDYMTHMENFYRLLAQTGKPVVNLCLPLNLARANDPVKQRYVDDIRDLGEKYGIALLDLSQLNLARHLFQDPLHVTPPVSYLIGLGMVPLMHEVLAAQYEGQGVCDPTSAYRVVTASDVIAQDRLVSFHNKMISLEYAPLDAPFDMELMPGERLVSVGYFRAEREPPFSGIAMQGNKYMFNGVGYFMGSPRCRIEGSCRIAPLCGEQTDIPTIMGEKTSGATSEFTTPNFVDALIYDPSRQNDATIVCRPGAHLDTAPIQQAIETIAIPDIGANAVDALRDLALRTEGRSIELAHQLMKLAQYGRPHGPLINEKIADYEARLKAGTP